MCNFPIPKKNSSYHYPSNPHWDWTHQPQELNLMTHVFHCNPCASQKILSFHMPSAFSPTTLGGDPPLESLTGLHLRLRCADFQLRPAFRFTSFTLCFLLLPWMVSSPPRGWKEVHKDANIYIHVYMCKKNINIYYFVLCIWFFVHRLI